MSRDGTERSIHHDLRGALSAVQMNLQTLEAMERGQAEATPEKRLEIVRRAVAALAEAVTVADRLVADDPDSAGGACSSTSST